MTRLAILLLFVALTTTPACRKSPPPSAPAQARSTAAAAPRQTTSEAASPIDELTLRGPVDSEVTGALAAYADWPGRYRDLIVSLGRAPMSGEDAEAWKSIPTDVTRPDANRAALISDGLTQSETYCAACHLRPPPSVLPKSAWAWWFGQKVAMFTGNGVFDGTMPPTGGTEIGIKQRPDKPFPAFKLSRPKFASIMYAYLSSAPEKSLPQESKPAARDTGAPFRIAFAAPASSGALATYSAVSIDENRRRIFLGKFDRLEIVSPAGKRLAEVPLSGVPTQIVHRGDAFYVTTIGPTILAGQTAAGAVHRFRPDGNPTRSSGYTAETVIDGLYRPVRAHFGDFDGNRIDDLVVSEFGMFSGRAAWFSGRADGSYSARKPLLDGSGFVETAVADFNADGRLDVAALRAQDQESVYLSVNQGKGRFTNTRVVQQHPAFGYNSLALADVNQDGHLDIVTTNGDNFDLFGAPLKNYHGVRVLLNDKANHFNESYFYPMYGAMQGLTADFDLDGDADIVAISYWPSRHSPEGFVYLENTGKAAFKAYHLQDVTGAWMAAAAGDWDGDGDPDLALVSLETTASSTPPFLLLENTARKADAHPATHP